MKVAVSRAPGQERVVTPLELFFDLVYVFAIGQLSHHLLAHVDLRTGAETAIMTLAVIYAWYMVAWGANWLDADRLPVRLLLVGLMFASLLMSVSIADAFDGRAWLFVGGYLLLQVGRSGFLILPCGAARSVSTSSTTSSGSSPPAASGWPARSRTATPGSSSGVSPWWPPRSVSWSLHWLPGRGRAIDLEHTGIAAGHLIERFRLFFIIALGETVLTTGTAFTDQPFTLERLIALAIGFTGTVALWWCYFQRAEGVGVEIAETSDDAGAVAWSGTWTLTLIVLALIGIAVGDELAIAHPGDDATLGFTILTFGGPALFLVAQMLFLRWALGRVPRSRPIGLAALAVLAVATAPSDDDRRHRRFDRRARRDGDRGQLGRRAPHRNPHAGHARARHERLRGRLVGDQLELERAAHAVELLLELLAARAGRAAPGSASGGASARSPPRARRRAPRRRGSCRGRR